MKRKKTDSFSSGGQQGRPRQPQVSCDFCRQRKLKCDRRQPCGSCQARGLVCVNGSNTWGAAPDSAIAFSGSGSWSDSSILGRLAALERTVFGSSSTNRAAAESVAEADRHSHSTPNVPSPPVLDRERHQTARFLDSAYNKAESSGATPNKTEFRIAQDFQQGNTPRSTATGASISGGQAEDGKRSTWLMSQHEAVSLVEDFVDNAYHLLPIVRKASVLNLIEDFYSKLSSRCDHQDVNPAHAALILSISATSAYFWNETVDCQHSFSSEKEAAEACLTWRQSALDTLAELHGGAPPGTGGRLEEAQARAIIAYLIYNVEGQSARFRFLHSCSVAVCREMAIHLVDSPGLSGSDNVQEDDQATKEIKRRLWWHITATDWMLGLNGGPLDGTYTIHPRHMNVAYPRNLNDNDLALLCAGNPQLTYPLNVPTQMSCFLQRIHLAEVCRAVVDARAPGMPDVEVTDYGQVLQLDRLFEHVLAEFPPFLAADAAVPEGAPRFLHLERAIIHLGFHSRRARLHRPFLLRTAVEDRYGPSREICLHSARTVLGISMRLLEGSLAGNVGGHKQPGPRVHRLGAVINHMFMACAVLAFHMGSQRSTDQSVAGSRLEDDNHEDNRRAAAPGDAEIREELVRACRLLAAAGEESTVAAGLVRGLRGLLMRYRVKGVDTTLLGAVESSRDQEAAFAEPRRGQEYQQRDAAGAVTVSQGQQTNNENDMTDGNLYNLDDIWTDFLDTMPMTEDWGQLFAGLDSYCGAT
ncbi:hypothetical protein QBC46DRAFT_275788 [Diplogelasinospora grovesii]|uniref:Zn(2)-C6 fungal-type domain-containing protein n=1 Tax=Diplogelasinospora grovesii TaxID=303347 RepID=A0AAN6NJ74_9PEZI|nr:hypothetical protein QBC46DRAFT_275788 [Diplogelasinospora grovesii]